MMANLIAEERIYATRVGGERIAIDVCIGTPYRVDGRCGLRMIGYLLETEDII